MTCAELRVNVATEGAREDCSDAYSDVAIKDLLKGIDQEADEVRVEYGDEPNEHHDNQVHSYVAEG